jgi:hypothetical protein
LDFGVLLNGVAIMLALTTIGEPGNHYKNMRALLATAIILTSAASLWAQGENVVIGSESLTAVIPRNVGMPSPISLTPASSDWLPPSQRLSLTASDSSFMEASRATSDRISLSLLPPISPSDVEITAATINLTSDFGILVNNSSTTIVVGQVNFITGVNYGGDSSGAERIEASRSTAGISEFSIFPPTPDSQIQFAQASEIQPVPEPSTFALGGLALGLIALARFKKQQRG